MKHGAQIFYVKCKLWLLNRKSVDQTAEKSLWTYFGMIGAIVAFVGFLAAITVLVLYITGFAEGVTTGDVTDAPGGWKK